MNPKNTLALVEAAPLLYRLYGATDSGWSIQHGFECGDGWFDILLNLSRMIEADLQTMRDSGVPVDKLPHALQVKEKLGGLRFYMNQLSEAWQERIRDAEADAKMTCELCGQPGTLGVHHGWWATLCPRHRMLSGYIPGDLGEIYFLGSEECPDSRDETKSTRDGLAFKGIVKLATGDLPIWAPEKSTTLSRAVVYAGDLPSALWPALSKLANEQGQIPVAKTMQYLNEKRWLPNVRAVLGLPPAEPGDFVEEAERLIREPEMELVGSLVLPACKDAVPVFAHANSPRGMKIVMWKHMSESVKLEFTNWHFGAQDREGPYWYDFQAWVRSKKSTH